MRRVGVVTMFAALLACGDGPPASDETSGTSEGETGEPEPATLRMFVSSTLHDGNLGALDGADQICQQLADDAGLGGTFLAWISAPLLSIDTRIMAGDERYVLVDGGLIAVDWGDLVDGEIKNAINIDETGMTVDAAEQSAVWTATQGDASYQAPDCEGWTSASADAFGQVGDVESLDVGWTNIGSVSCGTQRRVYCIEVAAGG